MNYPEGAYQHRIRIEKEQEAFEARLESAEQMFEQDMREAILTGGKYTYIAASNKELHIDPIEELAEAIWSDTEDIRPIIVSVFQGAPDAEIGNLVTAMVRKIFNKQVQENALNYAERAE